ncbi:MAG: AAA family ATPase [Dehalococcoidia bacterium]|nr:AAA family ATPase [Dehalococcoidia bacterium]
MYITKMKVESVPPFTSRVEFEFDRHVNVFVGPNAVGKTAVLLGLSKIPSAPPYRCVNYFGDSGRQELSVSPDWPVEHDEQAGRWADDPPGPKWDEIPFVYVGSTRLNLPEQADVLGDIGEVHPVGSPIVQQAIFEPVVATGSNGRPNTFDSIIVKSAIASEIWKLSEPEIGPGLDPILSKMKYEFLSRQQFNTAIELGLRCARSICNEIITSDRPRNFVEPGEGDIIEHLGATPPVMHRGMGIMTVDDGMWYNDGPLYAGNLSAGSQGTLMWVWLLALKMVHHYRYRAGWEKQPAIFLIDEIENHLHPTWQRRVIPTLLEHFPGLQIFATTHSPFVVAGRKKGQVHMLKRDADGVVTASTNEHDIIGWTTDEILRTFMEVDEPTDQQTIDRANRLRELRGKGTLSDAERDEMDELRRQVNEDFMSSSTPLEAQRERYGDMMLEFLRSRQSDLSQDGS